MVLSGIEWLARAVAVVMAAPMRTRLAIGGLATATPARMRHPATGLVVRKTWERPLRRAENGWG
jgi:hypothetical protein